MALIEDGLLYGTFELAAEGWLDRYDVAALIGEVLQRDIRAERVDPAKLGDALAPMRPMFDHYDRVGLRTNALSLRAITGREPRSLKDFFSGLAASSAP